MRCSRQTPAYSVLLSVGIPQLSAFTTFALLGCEGNVVNGIAQSSFRVLRASPAL